MRVAVLGLLIALGADAAAQIVQAPPAGRALRHGVAWPQLLALQGAPLRLDKPEAALAPAFKRLLGPRYADYLAGLAEPQPLQRIGDVLIAQGSRARMLGVQGSFGAIGRDGRLFAVIRSGAQGERIEQFGDPGLLGDGDIKHHYLEFADLHE